MAERQGSSTLPVPALQGITHVEIFVENALHAMQFYRSVFGFRPIAHAGLETQVRDRRSYIMQQGGIRVVLTAPLDSHSEIAEHLRRHGEGVHDIAFSVSNLDEAARALRLRDATFVRTPEALTDGEATFRHATVATLSNVVHSLIEWPDGVPGLLPGYRPLRNVPTSAPTGLVEIDHVAMCVAEGTLDQWVEFYRSVLGFHQAHKEDIATEYSGMNSRVVEDASGRIKFPLVGPAAGKRASQITEYLSYNGGPGVQHLAFSCHDIVSSTQALRNNSLEFLNVPPTYFDRLPERLGQFSGDLGALRELGILVDRDEAGLLMQTFTQPLQSRPTLFVELIQRNGSRGFGGGNIRALFEAVEHQQALRGNL